MIGFADILVRGGVLFPRQTFTRQIVHVDYQKDRVSWENPVTHATGVCSIETLRGWVKNKRRAHPGADVFGMKR